MEALFITSYASLGASFAATPRLRFGLALSAMYTRIDDVRAWSGGGNGLEGEGRSLLEVDGVDFGFGAGVFYDAGDVRVGLSYQSRPNVVFGSKLRGKLSNDIGGPSSADVELHQDLPDIVRWGLGVRVRPSLELRLFGAWERWSAFERQCVTRAEMDCDLRGDGSQPDGGHVLQNVPREFNDAVDVRAGTSIWVSPALELTSGIGFMSQAVPAETLEAGLPDFVGVTFSVGARYRVSDALSLGGTLSHLVSPAREARSTLHERRLPSQLPSASGHYTQSVSFADVNATLRF
jgi:long-chain fatty acid transport protein